MREDAGRGDRDVGLKVFGGQFRERVREIEIGVASVEARRLERKKFAHVARDDPRVREAVKYPGEDPLRGRTNYT